MTTKEKNQHMRNYKIKFLPFFDFEAIKYLQDKYPKDGNYEILMCIFGERSDDETYITEINGYEFHLMKRCNAIGELADFDTYEMYQKGDCREDNEIFMQSTNLGDFDESVIIEWLKWDLKVMSQVEV
jgi:hypothetical protein